jgi:hypothetical protein
VGEKGEIGAWRQIRAWYNRRKTWPPIAWGKQNALRSLKGKHALSIHSRAGG